MCAALVLWADLTSLATASPRELAAGTPGSHSWPWWRCMSLLSTRDGVPVFPFSRAALSWAAVSVSCVTALDTRPAVTALCTSAGKQPVEACHHPPVRVALSPARVLPGHSALSQALRAPG